MPKSMTAYGRGKKETPFGRWIVEMHSVNRKMLDIHMLLPKEFLRFDLDVRKWVSDQLQRGQITVRIQHDVNEEFTLASIGGMKQLKATWEKIARELGYDPAEAINLSFLLGRTDGLKSLKSLEEEESDAELKQTLKDALDLALKEMMVMKQSEGKHLVEDILERLKTIETAVAKVKARAPQMIESFKNKLVEKAQAALALEGENKERLFRELAFSAERGDVTEELTRLDSHIKQFRHYLASNEKSIGRTLDFLTQEMQREISTLAAKALESDVSHLTVAMRSECEKIREQVQNIE
jgi:uncharacterized protein (TIGR00255 family)